MDTIVSLVNYQSGIIYTFNKNFNSWPNSTENYLENIGSSFEINFLTNSFFLTNGNKKNKILNKLSLFILFIFIKDNKYIIFAKYFNDPPF